MTEYFLRMPETKTDEYLMTLLRYFEEEIMGEAYFYGLAEKFPEPHQREKMTYLAKVERYAAEAVRPLLDKYGLEARSDTCLHEIGEKDIAKSFEMGWDGLIDYMVKRFPQYMPEFKGLEAIAPKEDLAELKILTEHEVAAIEFANLEKANDPNSLQPLHSYLRRP